jgi:hypothetical protein
MPFKSGQVSVGTTATAIFTSGPAPSNDGVLIQNGGSGSVYIGGSGVTTTTGLPVAAGATVTVPTTGAQPLELFGVVASSTATVSYLTII